MQSVALRLISEREADIEAFQAEEYWSIEAKLSTSEGSELHASVAEARPFAVPDHDFCDWVFLVCILAYAFRTSSAASEPPFQTFSECLGQIAEYCAGRWQEDRLTSDKIGGSCDGSRQQTGRLRASGYHHPSVASRLHALKARS